MEDLTTFTKPRLTPWFLDIYIIRKALLSAIQHASTLFSGTLIDVGCGQMPYRDMILSAGRVKRYIGLELADTTIYRHHPDLTWDGVTIPLVDNAVDCAMATEVLEHCPDPERVLGEIFRILHPGGVLFFTVPFLWPLHNVPYDQYRYTPFSLARLLGDAGFEKVRLEPLGGWDESLAQMIGLFVRRRPMPRCFRLVLSFTAYPVVYFMTMPLVRRYLLRGDSKSQQGFPDSSMITGIWGIAYKLKEPPTSRDNLS